MEPLSVVLADDHAVLRAGVRLLLEPEPEFEVVAECADLRGTLEHVKAYRPRLLVLDLNMRDGHTLDMLAAILRASPSTAVVVLTMESGPAFARRALGSGVLGYVLKEGPPDELVLALREAARGRRYVTPRLADALGPGPPASDELSDREVEVLRLLAAGLTNAQIAEQLHLSRRTVEFHRAQLRSKLGVTDRAQMAAYARNQGLLGG